MSEPMALDAEETVWCKEDPTFTIFGADAMERCVEMAATSPVVRFPEGGIIVASPAAVDYVMHHPEEFSSGPDAVNLGSPEGLIPIQKDPPVHTHYRRILDPLFSARRMGPLEAGLIHHTNECIDGFLEQGHCDVVPDLAVPVPSGAILSLLGAPVEELPKFLAMKQAIFRPDAAPGSPERDAAVAAGAQEVYGYFGEVLDLRSAEPADDLASKLVELEAVGTLERKESLDICMMLLLAGLETITTTVSNTIFQLSGRPDLQRRLCDEPEVIPDAVEELLRVVTPIPTIPRVAVADVDVEGCPIHKGDRLAVWFPITNWDPAVYPEPERIDFERNSNRQLAFGLGRHRCLGSHLARLELQVILREWHRRIPAYHLEPGHRVRWTRGGREIEHLPIRFGPAGA